MFRSILFAGVSARWKVWLPAWLTVAAVLFLMPSGGLAQAAASHAVAPYLNPAVPIQQRVNNLVSKMTLEEKVSQMQNHAAAIPRLGIAEYDWWSEALHGVARSGYATVFPQAIGMAATWDAPLIHEEGHVIGLEARGRYNSAIREDNHSIFYGMDFWSPNVNIFRDPRWGRGQETYGEDPFLTGQLGTQFVRGLQGDNPNYYLAIATPKHFDVHSGPESERHRFNVNVSPHDLEDTYLPAFRATIVDGHADSIMCAYNAVDGAPACANKMLLQKTLRGDWKFGGYVVSDCGAVGDIADGHKFAPTVEQASVDAVRAGTDLSCGDEYSTLTKAVHDGLIQESEIDAAVKRLMTARIRLGILAPAKDQPLQSLDRLDCVFARARGPGLACRGRVDGAAEKRWRAAACNQHKNHCCDWTECSLAGGAGRQLQRHSHKPGDAASGIQNAGAAKTSSCSGCTRRAVCGATAIAGSSECISHHRRTAKD